LASINKMGYAGNDSLIPHYSKFIDFYTFDLDSLEQKEISLKSPFNLLFDS